MRSLYGPAVQARILSAAMVLCLAGHQITDLVRRPHGFDPESIRLAMLLVMGSVIVAIILALNDLSDKRRRIWPGLLEQPQRSMRRLALATIGFGVLAAAIAPTWNDERFNLEAARYLIDNGFARYLADYGSVSDWLSPHHPPLLAMAYGVVFKLTGSSLFAGRLVGLAFFIGAQWMTWKLGSLLFDRATGLIAAACLLLFPLVLFGAPTALFDMPFLFFFVAALFFSVRLLNGAGWGSAVLIAVSIGLGALTRYNMAFIYPLLLVLLIMHRGQRPWRNPKVWLALAGPAVVASPWMIYLASTDLGRTQMNRLLSYILVAFLPEGGPEYVREALLPILPVHLGGFLIPLIVYGCYVTWRERRRSGAEPWANGFVLWWILIIVLLTGLTIPHIRYLLPAFPAMCIAMARGIRLLGERGGTVFALALFCSAATVIVYDLLGHFGLIYIFY